VIVSTMTMGIEPNPQEELAMKRLIASVVLAIALLTSGAVVTQFSLVGTAYADGGDGGGE
jgi:hypothetical protein